VNEMIKHSFVPDIEHSVRFEYLLETVSPERAEGDCQKTKQSCNPNICHVERSREILILGDQSETNFILVESDMLPTCFLEMLEEQMQRLTRVL
jgi:hypothetical protein